MAGTPEEKQARRMRVLLGWRRRTAARGLPVPTEQDLMRIAVAGEVTAQGVDDAAVGPWRETLSFLLTQTKLGVVDPVDQIPDELLNPTGADPSSAPSGNGTGNGTGAGAGTDGSADAPAGSGDPVLAALRAWREERSALEPAVRELKDSHLTKIARTRSRTAADVRKHLPRGVAGYAERMAEVVRSAMDRAAAEAPRPAAEPPPAAPAAATPSSTPAAASPAGSPPSAAAQPGGSRADGADAASTRHGQDRPSDPSGEGTGAHTDEQLVGLELAHGDYAVDRAGFTVRADLLPESTLLRWPEAATGTAVVLYRVVTADDDYRPTRPQDAEPGTLTEGTRWADDRPSVTPIRHVQVWVHSGDTVDKAAASTPVLHAETRVVARLREPYVGVSGSGVVGQWKVPQGVAEVRVLRVPRDRLASADPGNRELWVNEEPNLNGFVDHGARAGETYHYLLYVKAFDGSGEVLSEPERFPVSVPAPLLPVTDLGVTVRPGPPAVLDLVWTPPPYCDVRVYVSTRAPLAGAGERPVDAEELSGLRLTDEALVRHPAGRGPDGRMSVQGVPWPTGSTIAYVTAVSETAGKHLVGRSVLRINLPAVTGATIVERTDCEILVFDWPDGADVVQAFVGVAHQDLASAMRGPRDEISKEDYENSGGLYFHQRLPENGCVVHVRALAFADPPVFGPPTALAYPGLTRLWYTLARGNARKGVPLVATLQIFSQFDRNAAPTFTLVYRPDRLPLHWRDGDSLPVVPAGATRAPGGTHFRPEALWYNPQTAAWNVRVEGLVGYVRLFVCPDPSNRQPIALIDPPAWQLRLYPSPEQGRAQ